MPKRPKKKRQTAADLHERMTRALQVLRTLREWEDEIIGELDRLCTRARPAQRSAQRRKAKGPT